jgi:hypothetical protein
MPESFWSTPIPIILILLAVGLVTAAALGGVMVASLRRIRRRTEQRLAEMARRLRLLESRIEGIEARLVPIRGETEVGGQAAGSLPKSWRGKRAGSSPRGPRGPAGPRDSPTLIAVPDLAAPEDGREHQAENELGRRHGEVWALAASGASPEEIARQTRQPIGQVELILGLYRQVHSSRGPSDHERSR